MDDSTEKNSALLVATLASFLTPFMTSAVIIALPSIGKEFSLNAILLSWVPTSYILAAAIFLVPFGRLADIYGRKRIFTYGIFIYTVSSFFTAISNSATALIFSRILQGIGSAMIFSTAVAIVTSVFPIGERGRVLGINVAAVYLGLSVGPFLGGFLTQQLGWRSIFIANLLLGLIIIFFLYWKLKGEWAEAKGEKFDLVGSLIYSLAIISIMYGFSLLPSFRGGVLILFGIVSLFFFVRFEDKQKHPVLSTNLFRGSVTFAFSNLAALINYCSTSAVAFLLSLYLQYIKKLSPQEAGLVILFQPVIMTIFSPLAGRLSDKVEPRIVASIGMVLTTIGLSLFIFLSKNTPESFIIANLILLGLGFGLFSSPNMNAIMSSVEKKFYGTASGTLATMRLTGQMLSLGIAMLIFAVYIGKVQITPEHYPLFLKSTKVAFAVFAALCFGGIFASLARGEVR
jgi:EmrB/QacA subfamily drug resistance transporter